MNNLNAWLDDGFLNQALSKPVRTTGLDNAMKLNEVDVIALAAMACGYTFDQAQNYTGDINNDLEKVFGLELEDFQNIANALLPFTGWKHSLTGKPIFGFIDSAGSGKVIALEPNSPWAKEVY